MYVDADFSDLWHKEHSALYEYVLYCTNSYIITFCGCLIHGVSKLQSEIALITNESEYTWYYYLLLEMNQYGLVSTLMSSPYTTAKTHHLE
jgi:hypothetical protein